MVELREELATKIKYLPNFLPETVEKFIDEYKAETNLEYPTTLLAEILIRLKPFFKIDKFNYFTNDDFLQDKPLIELFKAFHSVCNITQFNVDYCEDTSSQGDIAYITAPCTMKNIQNIFNNTKNVVIIEHCNEESMVKFLKKVKKDHVVIKYSSDTFDVVVIYKNLAMFD